MVVLQNPDQKWLFPDDVANNNILALMLGEEDVKSKDGKTTIPVLIFSTDASERTLVNLWKIYAPQAIKAYGKDTAAWKDKNFYLRKKDNKIEIVPVEENIG